MIVYLSGPMSGIANYNGEAFEAYAKKLRDAGFEVISPWELDHGNHDQPYGTYLARDLHMLLHPARKVERIYMMPGWEASRGARLELHAAACVAIEAYNADTMEKMENEYVL